MIRYLILNGIHVRGFQMLHSPVLVSPLPLFGACMFAHALASRLGLESRGVMPLVHRVEPHMDALPVQNRKPAKNAKPEQQTIFQLYSNSKRGACGYMVGQKKDGGDYAKDYEGPQSMSFQPSITGSGCFSIVIRIAGDRDGLEKTIRQEKLRKLRFAGGYIDEVERITVKDELPRYLPSGYCLMDASDEVQRDLARGRGIVESILIRERRGKMRSEEMDDDAIDAAELNAEEPEIISDITDESGIQSDSQGEPYEQRIPTTLGYALLGDAKPRTGARPGPGGEPIDSAPAESMIGLVRLVNTRRISAKDTPFWTLNWRTETESSPPFDYCLLTQSAA